MSKMRYHLYYKRKSAYQRLVKKTELCHKMIDYQGFDLDLKELTRQIPEITPATKYATLLDDYQFLLCNEMIRSSNDVKYVQKIRGIRIIAVAFIIRLSEILERLKEDPTNEGLKRELGIISEKMSRLIYKLEKSVLDLEW